MLAGEFRYTIDLKKRLFIPSKLREDLGETVVLMKGVDPCISVYSKSAWEAFEKKISEIPSIKARQATRFIYASIAEVQLDSQGRVLLPKQLCQYASLTQNAVVIGVGTHVEIWDEAAWDAFSATQYGEQIADLLMELGL